VITRRSTVRRNGVVATRRPDPDTWRRALELASGEDRRLELQTDGSVLVHNQPVR